MSVPVLDIGHLDRQTFGEAELRAEILAMFVAQSRELASAIRASAGSAVAADIAHRLKGSAGAVGAFRVAEAAAVCESGTTGQALDALDAAVAEAISAISGLS
jgi:HPt (histidine-containing phosphotransfer) domain-containing protein